MKLLVQKFGGTSVRDRESRSRAITHVKKALYEGYKVVVTVSAMGRKGSPYATDTILSLINYPDTLVSEREQDLLMSCGETISSIVFTHELMNEGISTVSLTGAQAGFLTNDDFTRAKIIRMNPARIYKELESHDVVVVAGFQGQTDKGETTTIGRGGSDTSAAALGAALSAEFIDIFTDVDGIMTADPRVVTSARALNVITYNEICNLAYQGAKVIHPRAVEIAMYAKVPLRVRSTYSDLPGTLVTGIKEPPAGKDISDRVVTGIAHMMGLTQIKVLSKEDPSKLQSDVFKSMAAANISVDFINISPSGVIYTINHIYTKKAVSILEDLGYEPEIKEKCAKVSTVGAGIAGFPGVTAKIVQSLTDSGIQILQSADSHTTIWVLIKEEDLVQAVNALHESFQLNVETVKGERTS
ncbi:aspartate kinase [Halobacillus halophilus]|uniref:Aspartokinase n=1 Tax=Halobacillus halophilus (strain ATCC 35676 / DSM 2266 / JCM 20832 / KCTC 3685 / LMG 17431 / NBRC 102448 / NCIMB 2269) TaxID=866895 RepID=I0JMR7_HALH3|nr:aspartate kinase [Halobacillus halophilus]ASF39516.1 aspartate kinase [Halobacillus halophilus]CCG45437.1 aspartate kinase [Halobacillus halophilus DSM 2266]